MRFLPVVAVLLVLAEVVCAIFFAANGSWLLGVLLTIGAVALVLVAIVPARRLARRRPPVSGYVERERVGF